MNPSNKLVNQVHGKILTHFFTNVPVYFNNFCVFCSFHAQFAKGTLPLTSQSCDIRSKGAYLI